MQSKTGSMAEAFDAIADRIRTELIWDALELDELGIETSDITQKRHRPVRRGRPGARLHRRAGDHGRPRARLRGRDDARRGDESPQHAQSVRTLTERVLAHRADRSDEAQQAA